MNKICKYNSIKLNKLIVGKEQHYENNSYIPIYLKDNNKINNLNVKTCKLYIANKLNQQSKYFLSLELTLLDINVDFNTFILKLEKFVKKRFKSQFNNKEFVPILKDNKKMYVNLNINNNNFIDINYKKIDKFKINTPTNGYFVLNIKNIWYNEYKWGINIYLYSALILPTQKINIPSLEVNNIKDIFKEEINENKTEEIIKDNKEYAKFFKMKSMKIPIQAIKHKMKLTNMDSSIIDYDCNTLTKDIFKKNNSINRNNMITSKDLLGNKGKLKKTVIIEKVKIKKDLNTPSLEEIQNQIKKMKNKNNLTI